MRKLFSFRSSSSSSGNSNPVPPPPCNEIYWETPWDGSIESQVINKVKLGSTSPKDKVKHSSKCPQDPGSGPKKQYMENGNSTASGLRRSLSFSSPAVCSNAGERDLNCLSDLCRSPAGSSGLHHVADYPIRCSVTPERLHKPKGRNQDTIPKTLVVEKPCSPRSSKGYFGSSGNSPYSSPVPLRCRTTRLSQAPKKILDLYIDGEQQERRPKNESQISSPVYQKQGSSLENKMLPHPMLPPRVQTTAPSSPTNNKEKLRSYSYRESKDGHVRYSSRDWRRDDIRPASPQKIAKNVVERICQVFPRKSKMKSREIDSETPAVEDIYEDISQIPPSMDSRGTMLGISASDQMPLCHLSSASYDEITNGYCVNEISGFQKHSFSPGDDPICVRHENSLHPLQKEEDPDMELHRKGKEADERVTLLSEELEQVKLQNSGFSVSALLQMIRNITDDRRNLAFEVSTQIQSRIAERAAAVEALKLAKAELETRTRRLEKEKQELQLSLEKELDRRSSDWSFKLEKYQSEEQRLRERVRELAEQNVLLQREVSSFNNKEMETRNRIVHSEQQLNEVIMKMEQARAESHNLQQALSELQECCKSAEADRDCLKRSFKDREKENKDLQKAVARLQRTCSEQEKTISGLRQGLGNEIEKQSLEKNDVVVKLQMEQVRLTGVELMLRREVESARLEEKSLRHENISLLNRLCGSENGRALSSFKLDGELSARVECLQNQCFSLLEEVGQLCGKLLEFFKCKTCYVPDLSGCEVSSEFDGYSVLEYDMKFQSFMRGVENLNRSLQMISTILQEKSELDVSESHKSGPSVQLLRQGSEGSVEIELKAEILLTRVLREKLSCKELELEQLQAELATSVRGHGILRCEIQSAQDSVSSLTHKMKDLELQMMRKDEKINELQGGLQESMKELTITKGILPKVSAERDSMWEEVKQLRENNMLLNYEVNSLKKKMEALEEDVLIKEGQITILKDSVDKKPFSILSMQEFTLQ